MNGINDIIKAFTILGSIISIKALIDSQSTKHKPLSDEDSEQLQILRRLEFSLKRKGIID